MDIFSILSMLGGLGLFLYGMGVMGDNLKKLAGGKLETILASLTSNRIKGFALGLFVTAVIQSSSATIVMLIGFVNSGLMQFGQTLSVVLGADLGTTVTAWILSLGSISGGSIWLDLLKPTSFTPILMIVGVTMSIVCKSDSKKDISLIMIGFAALMFGMNMMSGSLSGLKESESFGEMLLMFSNPIMGILVGAVLTAIIQSSSASVGVLQALSVTGAIPFSAAIPIVLGQNIGAAITPFISAINGNVGAKRVAFSNLYMKVIGVAVLGSLFYLANYMLDFAFMSQSVNMVTIAIVHSMFNVLNAMLLIPFLGKLEKLTVRTVSSKKEIKTSPFDTLDDRFISVPTFAIDKCCELVCEMADIAQTCVNDSISLLWQYNKDTAAKIEENEDLVDTYDDKLSTHIVKISTEKISFEDSQTVTKLLHCIGDIERIADHAVNILDSAKELDMKEITFSDEAYAEIGVLSSAVSDILDITTTAFMNDDISLARKVEPLERVINKLAMKIKGNHIQRMQSGGCTIEMGIILSDLLTNFSRIADHCSNIAIYMIEITHGSFEPHEYLLNLKTSDDDFKQEYDFYKAKYVL